jgi:hypothetical protein
MKFHKAIKILSEQYVQIRRKEWHPDVSIGKTWASEFVMGTSAFKVLGLSELRIWDLLAEDWETQDITN